MSILINGLEMPKEDELLCISIYPSGKVTIGMDLQCKQIAEAVEVLNHGDLIDKDPLFKRAEELEEKASAEFERYKLDETNCGQTEKAKWRIARLERMGFKYDISNAPVVIPAERSEE